MNESILYTVDTLHNAISSNRKVSFKCFDYNIKKEKCSGETAIVIWLIFSRSPLITKIIILSPDTDDKE